MMWGKKAHEKLSFWLSCYYYATPEEIPACRDSFRKYFELKEHQERLSEWELHDTNICTYISNMPGDEIRLLNFGIKFIHKRPTVEDLGHARRTFLDAVYTIRKVMSDLTWARVEERGTLELKKMFSYDFVPCNGTVGKEDWGLDMVRYHCNPGEQAGPNGSAQKAVRELLMSYCTEFPKYEIDEVDMSPMSRGCALQEACRRIDGAGGNTGPLWNALYSTSALERTPLRLDIDLTVYTTKNVVRWYGELRRLFDMSIQSEVMKLQVSKAADLGRCMSRVMDGEKVGWDGISMASDSDSERTLVAGEDCDVKKETAVEIEDEYKAAQQPHRRSWKRVLKAIGAKVQCSTGEPQWVRDAAKLRERSLAMECAYTELCESVLQCKNSRSLPHKMYLFLLTILVHVAVKAQVDQLRRLAKLFIILTKIQTEWAQVEALVHQPGVDVSEVNRAAPIDIEELSSYSWRSQSLRDCAKDVKAANKAMMQDATTIARQAKQLQEDLNSLFEDHQLWRAQFEESRAGQGKRCSA
ncbi:hypothetical protein CSUB01_12518 [Colletotrichum sublineola]|uniref:Uncharacterized protein n=1 Tax=Colletotrichum sublineola TaxID=1173701 RepID=A0A066XPM0_COLSU|nr:hypothetical protein CSUB01_12518 [Colletotrichum sublineola]